ncbi:hypothetical protein ACFQL1_09880 [Halomicroarcula sp. GCM10025709]|uniref:hypothetical protein n=1 Tax=Haloarcula TaxID=2237 RepID=UPI0024C3EE56|nr:hypothetical protein [Halomicroarcula sp. YJ-61-S]
MDQMLANTGNVNDDWKRWVVVWLLAVVGVSVVTDFGFWGTLVGTAGLWFVFWGLQAVFRAITSRSVEETAVGSLGGRSAPVELVGDARPVEEPLTAPLTDTECVAYQVQVMEYYPSGNEGGE